MNIGFLIVTRSLPIGEWQLTSHAFTPEEEKEAQEKLDELREQANIYREYELITCNCKI